MTTIDQKGLERVRDGLTELAREGITAEWMRDRQRQAAITTRPPLPEGAGSVAPATIGYRFWLSDGDHLFSPFYFGARWDHASAESNCATGRCAMTGSPCGWCGLTFVTDSRAFADFMRRPDSIPESSVGMGRVRVAGVVRAYGRPEPTLPAWKWNDPSMPEFRVRHLDILRLHVHPRDRHITKALSARYNVPVRAALDHQNLTATPTK